MSEFEIAVRMYNSGVWKTESVSIPDIIEKYNRGEELGERVKELVVMRYHLDVTSHIQQAFPKHRVPLH